MSCDLPEIDQSKLAEMARTCACFNFRKASRSVTQLFDQYDLNDAIDATLKRVGGGSTDYGRSLQTFADLCAVSGAEPDRLQAILQPRK